MLKEVELSVDYENIYKEYVNLDVDNLLKNNFDLKQLAIQCRPDADKDQQLSESCGSLHYDWVKYESNPTGELPLRDKFYSDEDFTETCDIFKNTIFSDIIEQLKSLDYNVVRGRFMLMPHKTCLTYHTDPSPRIHIPIYTNENCMMIIEDKVYRLPYGSTYIVDTTKTHTALNASKDPRVHLIFSLKE